MGRRAQSRIHPGWLIAAFVVITFLLLGGFLFLRGGSDPFRTDQALDPTTYLDYALSLRGNTYKFEGVVHNNLAWDPTRGRLISVEVTGPRGPELLPVLVPAELDAVNLQKGQRFWFRVKIVENGVILVDQLRKT
ncbi:MAG: hypothetical protein SNJ84_08425 [Verrucomicrobiia bacterium]